MPNPPTTASVSRLPPPSTRRALPARLAVVMLGVMLIAALAVGGLVVANQPAPATPSPSAPALGGPAPQLTPSPAISPSPLPTPLPPLTPSASPSPSPTPEGPTSKPPEKLRGFVWPLRNARLSSPFGPRSDGSVMVEGERYHDGIDLASWCGSKIRAAHDGTVLYVGRKFDEYAGYSDSLDRFYARLARIGGLRLLPIVVVIDYGNGYRGLYAHLSTADVEAGDVVEAGQVIGREGATGRATGCHLHYSLIRMDGAWQEVAPQFVDSLHYPALVRERVDPLLVLPLGDQYAPRRFRERYGPKPVAPGIDDHIPELVRAEN